MKSEDSILAIPKQGPVIAIDGPAGTGKSSATHRLADALGFIHVDTGALYRCIGLCAWKQMKRHHKSHKILNSQADIPTEEQLAVDLAHSMHFEFKRIASLNPVNRIFANGQDLTDQIRTPEVSLIASRVSAYPGVRASLLGFQRRLGCVGRTILEGRDIGTVIFPDADIKFFLTATVDERAKRRLIELEAAGSDAPSFEEVKVQILERDRGDSSRAVAPLRKAADAIELDTSLMTLDQVVSTLLKCVQERLGSA
jgi:cytidylate kinase